MPRQALAEINANALRNKARQRPGPKPKDFAHRVFKPTPPKQKERRSYSRETKLQVITWLFHHRIYDPRPLYLQAYRIREGLERDDSLWRPSTNEEAAKHWLIPAATIGVWWTSRYKILYTDGKRSRCDRSNVFSEQWPELEAQLCTQFLVCRLDGRLISRGWFRRRSQNLAFWIYGPNSKFKFTAGWFFGFCRRYDITRRRVTRQAQKQPKEYQEYINKFLQFVRRNSVSPEYFHIMDSGGNYLLQPLLRLQPSNILNMDEVPIPFEFLDGYTYHICGEKTITGKTDRSGWGKRQATLILYIFANGIPRILPKLVFHGKPDGLIRKKESHLYDPRVTVEFNNTAYNNGDLFNKWIDEELAIAINGDGLLIMDHASFHKTESALKKLRSYSILPALIPGGCTSLL